MSVLGRPTDLTEEVTLKIRQLVLDGKKYREIQEMLEISPNTWDTWVYKDYKDFRKNLQSWKHEKLVKMAESNVGALLVSEDERVQADMTKFTLKTLDKDNYSERTEQTGKDGKDLIPKPILSDVQSNDSNKEDNADDKPTEVDTGGDIGKQDNINTAILNTLSPERQETNID